MPPLPDPTTPTHAPSHGGVPRGLESTPSSSTTAGRFGRMFRHLPVYDQDPRALEALARKMIQPAEPDKGLKEDDEDQNTSTIGDGELRLPAGYTYFGQFVDHDITFDPSSSLSRQNDPDALTDFRTPRFDLDSLYGRGPADQPYMYEPLDGANVLLALGEKRSRIDRFAGPDLPRGPNDRALIGDPRNDENLIVSQLQVAFIKFHNNVVERVKHDHGELRGDDRFKLAQQTVRWHYQWIVIHDFLRRLVGEEVIKDILRPKPYQTPGDGQAPPAETIQPHLRFYHYREQPFMPVEFSVAAYRFGHSMARPSYFINDRHRTRIPLFGAHGDDPRADDRLQDLHGFRKLPRNGGVQWKYFLPVTAEIRTWPNRFGLPQPSYLIDAELGHPLGTLPARVAKPQRLFEGIPPRMAQSLAFRNLLRGRALGLPSGQDVARAMGITPLTDNQLYAGLRLPRAARDELKDRAPLWFYVLKEAGVRAHGEHLGPVGGRIVAEVLIGLLAGDPLSYLSVNPTWTPYLGSVADTFTLSDLVTFTP